MILAGPFGRYYDGSVCYVLNVNDLARNENRNTILYCSSDSFTGKLIDILREPYEEAMRKAKDIPLEELKVHKETNQERITDQIFENLALDWYKKDTLYTKSIGCDLADKIGSHWSKIYFFSSRFVRSGKKARIVSSQKTINCY